MSIDAFSWAWRQEAITPAQKLLLICLADGADMNGCCSLNFPKLRRFACMGKASDEQIFGELRKLRRKGLLRIDFIISEEKPIILYTNEREV